MSPNPLVGSVIVTNGNIIGEGWHKAYGGAHAEVNALGSVTAENKHLLKQATMYVNLEPCNHHGKTPPCVDLILSMNIPRVVICNVDPNPLVAGKGIQRLRKNGVEIITGILEEEGLFVNRRFFTFQKKNRPYIILKWAQTSDSFLAKNDQKQHWITTELSRRLVHKWRSKEDAILVGTTTAKIDNPSLTNRFFEQEKQPVRIVFDRQLSIPKTHALFDHQMKTIVITEQQKKDKNDLQYCQLEFDKNLIINMLQELTNQNIQSLIVEGGNITLQHFINQNLWDEARILTGKTQFIHGIKAPELHTKKDGEYSFAKDTISYFYNHS